MGLTVADKRVVTILGVVPVFITTRRAISKEVVHTRQLLYIVKELKGTFISRDALQDLGVVSEYFPQVPPAFGKAEVAEVSAMEHEDGIAKDWDLGVDRHAEVSPCDSPTRISVLPLQKLQFPATEGNTRRMCQPQANGAGQIYQQLLQAEGRINHQLVQGVGQVYNQLLQAEGRVHQQLVQGAGQVYNQLLQAEGRVHHQPHPDGPVHSQHGDRGQQGAEEGGRVQGLCSRTAHAKELLPLLVGDDVMIQNQRGNSPGRWDNRGVVAASQDDCADAPVPAQRDGVAVGQPARRWDKKGVVVASRDDRDEAPVPAQVVQEPVVGDTPDAEVVQPDEVAVGQPARRWDKKGVELASRDDRDDAPVPAQVVQEPVVGDTPDAEGVQQDDVAVGQPADDIVIDGPEPAGVQVQLEASSIRRFSRATQGMTWAQVVQVQPEDLVKE